MVKLLALVGRGPQPPQGVRRRAVTDLSHQAASNYLAYDPATQSFTLPPEQALVFAIDDSPVSMLGAVDVNGGNARKRGEGPAGVQDGWRGALER